LHTPTDTVDDAAVATDDDDGVFGEDDGDNDDHDVQVRHYILSTISNTLFI
jgi:hypothetical protein